MQAGTLNFKVIAEQVEDTAALDFINHVQAEAVKAALAGTPDETLPVLDFLALRFAPSGGNLLVQDDRLRVLCTPPEPGQFHVPGIDASMRSAAEALGPDAVGLLLTGMGRDGAAGLLAMRERGALTIGQDEASSAVYGMPAAAAALGAVDRQLPLDQIGPALCEVLVPAAPATR